MDKEKKVMEVTLEQQKLISNSLRAKIIYVLNEKAMTAKQVADELGKSTGSIHYHIQKLYQGGILDIVETKNNRGIIEKYYAAKAIEFRLKEEFKPKSVDYFMKRGTTLSLTDDELEDFIQDFDDLIERHLKKTMKSSIKRTPYQIYCEFKKMHEEEDES